MRRPLRITPFDILVYTVMTLALVFCLVPFVYIIALSFSSPQAIVNNKVSLWPVGFNLKAYSQIFSYPNFFRAYGNTLIYTILGTISYNFV